MTLSVWDGGPIDLSPFDLGTTQGTREAARANWAHFTSSSACPDCLLENGWQWQLTWRLPWHFVCPSHHRLLVHLCTGCGQPLMRHRTDRRQGPPNFGAVPVPSECNNPPPKGDSYKGANPAPCGFSLQELDALPLRHGRILAAQTHLLATLETGGWTHTTWHDLRILTAGLLRYLDPESAVELLGELPDPVIAALDAAWVRHRDLKYIRANMPTKQGPRTRTFTDTPDTPALLAVAATLASDAISDISAGNKPIQITLHTLDALHQRVRTDTSTTLASSVQSLGGSPQLVEACDLLRTRNLLVTRAPNRRPAGGHPVELRHIPRLWWTDRFLEVRDLIAESGTTDDFARTFLSVAAAKTITLTTWEKTADQFGWAAPTKAKSISANNISRLRKSGHLDTVLDHIHDTLTSLSKSDPHARVDWVARRKALAELHAITPEQWLDICAHAGEYIQVSTWRCRNVAAWLWTHHGNNLQGEYPGFAAHGNHENAVEFTGDSETTTSHASKAHSEPSQGTSPRRTAFPKDSGWKAQEPSAQPAPAWAPVRTD